LLIHHPAAPPGLPPDLPGVSLIAVGGLGRRECAPHSDLDLVLLHSGGQPAAESVEQLASHIWYPIWDARLGLDHSVRTLSGALSVAHDDVKVALGLLDARHIAGDARLTAQLAAAAIDQWRRTAVRQLPKLREITIARWQTHGELAFLLEGDLKEAAGGLRDVGVLRGIGYAGVADAMRPAVRAARRARRAASGRGSPGRSPGRPGARHGRHPAGT
jgi:[protein-PII] uridylyltransferase